jgi:subtilase family serine protease
MFITSNNTKIYLLHCLLVITSICGFSGGVIANPITDENLNPGSRGWVLSAQGSGHDATDAVGQIKGYMSATSVNKGGQIDFKVSVNPAQNFTIEIYRVGWYGGMGGRLMLTTNPIVGISQPTCLRDEPIGMVACNWSSSYTLTVPTTWTSGVYLAKLKNANGFDSGTIFVVRDDNRSADFLYKQSVNTYQAYNEYPEGVNGKSLYEPNIIGEIPRAYKVSYNRPYGGYETGTNGYGDFVLWELSLVKWLEKEGYDVAYTTDVDFQTNGAALANHKNFISPGHDEYWSKEIRDAAEAKRSVGGNLAFFGANNAYWQVRFEPDSNGVPNRTMVGYKEDALTMDPISDPALKTGLFRSAFVNRPEQTLQGVQFITYNRGFSASTYTPLIVKNTSHWVYEGTGLIESQAIPGIVGYEIDSIQPTFPMPSSSEFTILAESPFLDIHGQTYNQNSVIYKTLQGGWVFSSGTIGWEFALDFDPSYSFFGDKTSPAIRTISKNILNKMLSTSSAPTVSIASPITGSTVSGNSVEVSATATDNDGVASVQFKLDGVDLGLADTTAPYSVTWDSTTSTNGSHTLTATALDTLGNVATSITVNVMVDNNASAPLVGITAPLTGSTVTGSSVAVAATATDSDGIAGVQFKLDGINLGAEDSATPYEILWDSSTVSNGSHILTATARDSAGNTTTSNPITVTVSNTAPVLLPDLVVTSLSYNNGVFTCTVTNQGTAATTAGLDIGVGYLVDGVEQTWGVSSVPLAAGASVTINTDGGSFVIPNGTHLITAHVDDLNRFTELSETNNDLSQSITVGGSDTTLPTADITAPANNSTVSGVAVNIAATATDNVAVAGVQFKLDGANLGAEDTTAPYSLTWDTTTVTNGNHTLTAVARDTAFNTATSSTVTVTVDNTVITPLPDVVVTDLVYSNGVFTSTIKNQGTAPTPTGKSIGVGYSVDGVYRTWGARSTPLAAGASATVSTNGGAYIIPNGVHTISAKVDDVNRFVELDETNNTLTQTITIGTGDTTLPTTEISTPANNSTVSGTAFNITATATDNVAVVGVQFKLDGANLGTELITSPYSFIWDTTSAVNGSHSLTVVARDAAGNTATSTPVVVTVNNSGASLLPDVIVTDLVYSNGVFTSTIKNQGTAPTPSGVTIGVGYSVDGVYRTWGARSSALAAGATATISTNGGTYIIPNGTHTISAKVDDVNRFAELDEANNSLTLPLNVNSGDSVPPTVAIDSPANNSTVSGTTVNIAATASDNVEVAGVQFKLDGVNLGVEDTASPYSLSWDSTIVANGNHTLTAVARDTGGNTATSASVLVNVNNTAVSLPDVIVTGVNYVNGKFTCTITNQGTKATPSGVVIGVSYLVNGVYKTWGARSTPLAAGSSATIGHNGPAYIMPSGSYTISAKVDDLNRFAELDETNNTLTVPFTMP